MLSFILIFKIFRFSPQIGSLLSFFLSGRILTNYTWEYVFYFWSIVAVAWFILFVSFIFFVTKTNRNILK